MRSFYTRYFIIGFLGLHGRRHEASRHMSLKALLTMGIGC